nr:PREDICTED: uncharacterized protein LOC106707094 [Latimeria chalumnae]|eukprot:XP_014354408.1 PREDICTED: uncharacterized protein LOC106707094 [Latimeria chalumnae]
MQTMKMSCSRKVQMVYCGTSRGCLAKPLLQDAAVCASVVCDDVGTQCTLIGSEEIDPEEESDGSDMECDDPCWEPMEEDTEAEDDDIVDPEFDFLSSSMFDASAAEMITERKFIVFESALRALMMSNEVNSCAMELEGLKQSFFAFLSEKGIEVADFTSDHHPQIRKYMRENKPGGTHWFDVWHVAKGDMKCSRQHKYLEDIICNKRLVNDVKRLSPSHQTYLLKSFHRGICLSAPKFVHYHHESMKARLQLTALHHNENCNRKQRQHMNGGLYWSISYPKSKHGGHVLKAVKEKCSCEYVCDLLQQVLTNRLTFPSYRTQKERGRQICTAKPLISSVTKIAKEAITNHLTRFNMNGNSSNPMNTKNYTTLADMSLILIEG